MYRCLTIIVVYVSKSQEKDWCWSGLCNKCTEVKKIIDLIWTIDSINKYIKGCIC